MLGSLAIAGCGKSSIVAVNRPVLPMYVCASPAERPGERCARRFDAGQLIGLRLPAAEERAHAHGFRVAPGHLILAMDAESNRLDVECDSTSRDCTVVRIAYRG
jgi:hypothetical protein